MSVAATVRRSATTAAAQWCRAGVPVAPAAFGRLRTFSSTQVTGTPQYFSEQQQKYSALGSAKGSDHDVHHGYAGVSDDVNELYTEIYASNWGDYLMLVYNMPFWEAELDRIAPLVAHDASTAAQFKELQEMMDALYISEDVRDHINELCELATRSSGLMGTGWGAMEPVSNPDEHAEALRKQYEELLAKYPQYKPKIESTVGHGLAIYRQKHKFKFGSMHRYFF